MFLLGLFSVGQDSIKLLLRDGKTFVINNGKQVETRDYVIHIDKRKVYIFNFKGINYDGEVVGKKSKCLEIYCNRTILRLSDIVLRTKGELKIKLWKK